MNSPFTKLPRYHSQHRHCAAGPTHQSTHISSARHLATRTAQQLHVRPTIKSHTATACFMHFTRTPSGVNPHRRLGVRYSSSIHIRDKAKHQPLEHTSLAACATNPVPQPEPRCPQHNMCNGLSCDWPSYPSQAFCVYDMGCMLSILGGPLCKGRADRCMWSVHQCVP